MPVSKNRRRNVHKKKARPQVRASPKVHFTQWGVEEENFEAVRATALAEAQKSVADFPKILDELNAELQKADPIGILATVASYGLQTPVSPDDGVSQKTLLKDISQHHIELLQALVLGIPIKNYPTVPFKPQNIEIVLRALPRLADTFFHRRILAAQGVDDEIEFTLLSLQERMRAHTQIVRNWGYYSDVVRISRELYADLDKKFKDHFGFTATDIILIMHAILSEFERRSNEQFNILANVIRESNKEKMVRAYYRLVPDLVGSPSEFLNALPKNIDILRVKSLIMGHFDLRRPDCAKFDIKEVSVLTDIDSDVVTAALHAISLVPGSLADSNVEHIFLGNPVWSAPGISLGAVFFFPIPMLFFSNIHRIMDRLAGEAGQKSALEDRRSKYLEGQLFAAIEKALPGATVTQSAKWSVDKESFETDVLAVIDRTVLIVEAKSNRLTELGLRGAPERVKRHVNDLVVYPSVQSARLESLVHEARAGKPDADAIVRALGIDPAIVDQVIRLSVTLDDFSVLSSAEAELKAIGWVPSEHNLAPTINIADLLCVIDILDNPLLFLHYISERAYLQKNFQLLGDELDFLGLYIETGFNIAGLRQENTIFSPSGMSEQIDRYYTSRDAGIHLLKPKVKLGPLFSKIIKQLNDRRTHGWTTVGIHLLSSADQNEQKDMERKLVQLRGIVRRTFRDPRHINSIRIKPPENRKSNVIFYLFPEQLRESSRATMQHLVSQAFGEDANINGVVAFGRSTERWGEPYEVACFARRPNV